MTITASLFILALLGTSVVFSQPSRRRPAQGSGESSGVDESRFDDEDEATEYSGDGSSGFGSPTPGKELVFSLIPDDGSEYEDPRQDDTLSSGSTKMPPASIEDASRDSSSVRTAGARSPKLFGITSHPSILISIAGGAVTLLLCIILLIIFIVRRRLARNATPTKLPHDDAMQDPKVERNVSARK